MSSEERPDVAVILSIIGGVLVVAGGAMMLMIVPYPGLDFGMMGGLGDMMGGFAGMMQGFGIPIGFMGSLSLIGIVSGLLVVIGAAELNARPADHNEWGIVILAFSLISFLGMGGFYIGAILGIIGGALAMTWRPANKP
jgi:hypothetical protein